MTFEAWITQPVNWAFLAIGLVTLASGFGVVAARNVVHAALFLVGTMGGIAALFLLLSAEFVAWALVLIYVGAVIILLLFGIMITRAPTGIDPALSGEQRVLPAILALALFGLITWSSFEAFGASELSLVGEATATDLLGEMLVTRFVIPFEVVGFVLLGALVGGITIARRDLTPLEEEQRGAV
ncbi:MAG TPA: NADH-quinone oxidoreductase subunit J [Acidimicrobiia bacterium]